MNEKQFRKIVREELKTMLSEGSIKSALDDVVSKFYLLIIQNDINAAREYLQNHPELNKIAQDIKIQSKKVASELIKDEKFWDWLIKLSQENKEK